VFCIPAEIVSPQELWDYVSPQSRCKLNLPLRARKTFKSTSRGVHPRLVDRTPVSRSNLFIRPLDLPQTILGETSCIFRVLLNYLHG